MTHDHVEYWACLRSAGARLSTRETGNEASAVRGRITTTITTISDFGTVFRHSGAETKSGEAKVSPASPGYSYGPVKAILLNYKGLLSFQGRLRQEKSKIAATNIGRSVWARGTTTTTHTYYTAQILWPF